MHFEKHPKVAPIRLEWEAAPSARLRLDPEEAFEKVMALAKEWTEFRLFDFKCAVAEAVPFGNDAVRAVGVRRILRSKPHELPAIRAEFIAHLMMRLGDSERRGLND